MGDEDGFDHLDDIWTFGSEIAEDGEREEGRLNADVSLSPREEYSLLEVD